MKKTSITLLAFLGAAFIMIGADFLPDRTTPEPARKKCLGYTIIEAGKGIDCHGDTIKLVKNRGFYELASSGKD